MAGRKLDDYKSVKFYEDNTKAKQSGFSKFDVDGEHFFCRYVDGDIAIISQAYAGRPGRDNGIESVKKNEKISSRYKFEDRDGGMSGFSLKAGNGQEIAVSPSLSSAAAVQHVAGRLTGKVKAQGKTQGKTKSKAVPIAGAAVLAVAGTSAAAAKSKAKPKAKAKPSRARKGSPAALGTLAKGNVRLAEMTAPKAVQPAKLTGTVSVKAGLIVTSVQTAAPIPATPAATVAAPMAAAAIVATAAGVKSKSKTQAVGVSPMPPPRALVTAAVGQGVWGWLKWALLALAVLLAVLFLFKACAGGDKIAKSPPIMKPSSVAAMTTCWNGTKAKDDEACPEQPVEGAAAKAAAATAVALKAAEAKAATERAAAKAAAAKMALEEAAKRAKATATVANVKTSVASVTAGKMTRPSISNRICGLSSNALFNVANVSPIDVPRLGTNPQFGNSLSLTPDEFYLKLKAAYDADREDRLFLELVAQSLGYEGFMDMDASMFSNDSLTNGVSGLLGLGSDHMLQFSTLSMSDSSNLEAFKVRSANGTDVHFMKRCGNFMYVCQPQR